MGTPATVLEARGVNNLVKGMASKSMVNLVLAVFVASVIGVTVAYPSNVQDILNSENAENKAKIEQILSHFPPNEQQDDSEDIEKRSKSFSAWGGKRGGQPIYQGLYVLVVHHFQPGVDGSKKKG